MLLYCAFIAFMCTTTLYNRTKVSSPTFYLVELTIVGKMPSIKNRRDRNETLIRPAVIKLPSRVCVYHVTGNTR